MTARQAKHLNTEKRVRILPGAPDPPPNWKSARRKERLTRIVGWTLMYLRKKSVKWEEIAELVKAHNGKDSVTHQYVSDLFKEGMRYLMDHQWIIDAETDKPVTYLGWEDVA